MHQAFGTLIWVVCIVGGVFAVIALALSGRTWSEHGKGGMVMDRDASPRRSTAPVGSARERDQEIAELIAARNARRARRGEAPLDADQEIARLTAPPPGPRTGASAQNPAADEFPGIDAELRDEVRQLVVARNNRRIRAGKEPLDVEAELRRELRKVSQL